MLLVGVSLEGELLEEELVGEELVGETLVGETLLGGELLGGELLGGVLLRGVLLGEETLEDIWLLGEIPVAVVVVKMLVVWIVVSVASTTSTIWMIFASCALTVEVMKRVEVDTGVETTVGATAEMVSLKVVSLLKETVVTVVVTAPTKLAMFSMMSCMREIGASRAVLVGTWFTVMLYPPCPGHDVCALYECKILVLSFVLGLEGHRA